MVKNKAISESAYISELAIHGIQEKKGNDIVRLDLRNLNSSVTDYFVICHADSTTQVKAIANSIRNCIISIRRAALCYIGIISGRSKRRPGIISRAKSDINNRITKASLAELRRQF